MCVRLVSVYLFCCLSLLSFPCFAQDSRPCRLMLKKKQYQKATNCFEKLFETYPKKLSFLRNQAIIHRMWAKARAKDAPAVSCHLLKQAISLYKRYQKHVKAVTKLEITARIVKLRKQMGLSSLSISTTPNGASLTLVGYQFQKKVTSPYIFANICPGKYILQIDKKEYVSLQTKLVVTPKQPLAKSFKLRPKNPYHKSQCPPILRIRMGQKGCRWWTKCNRKQAHSCVNVGNAYQEMGKEIESVHYFSLACKHGDRRSCFTSGAIYESMNRFPRAIAFYTRACRQKDAVSCQKVAEIFALRSKALSSNSSKIKRNCKVAIAYYHRACKYGLKSACTKACNTIEIYLPVILHSVGHVGGLVGSIIIASEGNNGKAAEVLGYGGFTLFLSGALIPFWHMSMSYHSLPFMLASSAIALTPIAFGLAFWAADRPFGSLGAFGLNLLFLVSPVFLTWTLYGWWSYATHEAVAQEADKGRYWNTDKHWTKATRSSSTPPSTPPPVRIYWSPVFLQNGVGFVLGGQF